jgi:hypothetical protein
VIFEVFHVSAVFNLLLNFSVMVQQTVDDEIYVAAVEPVVIDGNCVVDVSDLVEPVAGHKNRFVALLSHIVKLDVFSFQKFSGYGERKAT